MPGVLSVQVVSVGSHVADRFTASLALSAADAAALSEQTSLAVEIRAGFDGGWTSLVLGAADTLHIDAVRQVLTLEGRDLTALFLAAQTSETFSNRTSSEIAEILAQRRGLQAAVTATSTLVGRDDEAEHDRLTLNQFSRAMSEWDLLVWLAQQEGFEVYVEGQFLYFCPPAALGVPALTLFPQDCIALQMERSLLLAQGVNVTVKTWNSLQGQAYSGAMALGASGAAAQSYIVLRPNLTATQAQQLAQSVLSEISQQEWTFQATIPGELQLTPQSIVALQGTGSGFDQLYRISCIERCLDQKGFVEIVRGSTGADVSAAIATLQSAS